MKHDTPNRKLHRLQPIGMFDSGIGGLSILREIRRQLPTELVLYFADQAKVPYGPRTLEEVRRFSHGITEFLLDQGAKLIVVACNTASAASLGTLRRSFPGVSFVGMEPAVKPAAQATQSQIVGVLATPATFQGELYASVVERFAEGVTVLPRTLPGLVEQIEDGALDDAHTRAILEAGIGPLLEAGADTLVLACTHYPFVIPLIKEIAGPRVRVIDPSPAIARQAARLLHETSLDAEAAGAGGVRFYTSGDPVRMEDQLTRLDFPGHAVDPLRWGDEGLARAPTR